jgi:hypothetical protein
LSQTTCAQISVQGVFRAWHPDCFIGEGANLRKIQQTMGRLGTWPKHSRALDLSLLVGPITIDPYSAAR